MVEEKIKKPMKSSGKSKVAEAKKEIKPEKKTENEKNLLAVIRISGLIKTKSDIENTLYRLRLRRKYSCVLIHSTNKNLTGMLEKVKYFVAYGEIEKNILIKLLNTRARSIKGDKKQIKINAEEAAGELINGKNLEELGLKGFFRLHPPRKGINSKQSYPKGILGNNKNDINKLIERML